MRMSDPEIDFFSSELLSSRIYLEYGSGGSTKLAVGLPNIESITSVESDPTYIEGYLRSDVDVQLAIDSERLRFIVPDIGATGDWGKPQNNSKIHLWPNYALCPFMHGYKPDLILIDGRFRVACALAAALQAPNSTILMHDYANRYRYHILEKFFILNKCVDTLARFRLKSSFDEKFARKLLRSYLYAPTDIFQTRRSRIRNFFQKKSTT